MKRVSFIKSKERWFEFLLAITEREIKLRYKFTKLGFYWMFLNPILQMLIIGFAFQFLVPIKINNYFIFLFTGIIVWNYFVSTVSKNTNIILNERSLIQKSNFPRETIVLSSMVINLINFLISLVLLMLFLILTNQGNYKVWFLLPLAIINLVFVTSGFSFFLSAINVKHRDIDFMVSAILPLWFYGTPILYSLNMLPKTIAWIFYFNPITNVIEFFRYIFLGLPVYSLTGCYIGITINLILCFTGFIYFKRKSLDFNDWI